MHTCIAYTLYFILGYAKGLDTAMKGGNATAVYSHTSECASCIHHAFLACMNYLCNNLI